MTSLKENDVSKTNPKEEEKLNRPDHIDLSELPPSGTSLHRRRKGEPPAYLSVKSPSTPSDVEGSSPCTAGPINDEFWTLNYGETPDPEALCERMLQRLKDREDQMSLRGKHVAQRTKETIEALDQLEKLLDLLGQFVALKDHNARILKKLQDVNQLKRIHDAHKRISAENERLRAESKDLQMLTEAFDAADESEYGQVIFDSIMNSGRLMKRTGSKWRSQRFGGSLLRKQRSRSAGGHDSDISGGQMNVLRRRSDGVFSKEVEKSKVSKWTKVKAAFRWEKAQWPPVAMGGAAGAVAAGAMVGAVALAGSNPASASPANPEQKDSASLTPGSALSLTPNSSCEELRIDSGVCRKSGIRSDENENTFLHAPTQDDSSTSPSPNKLHKSPWGKMRDILQTHKESVRKKSGRSAKNSPDVVPMRRRSFSDGGDSDAPPALTITIPSSEELESEPSLPVLRKQRSLELGARPPQNRPPRASKWTKVKRAFLTSASASVPSSPSRHSAFFTDADTEGLSSGCEASGVREEIRRDYAVLQSRLQRELSDRRASRPVATEEQLSADFRKKLTEWQRIKGVKQPPPVPARQDLSEDFLKKWDEWKRLKETNSVPAWEKEAKPDEVLVQTSTGLFKFQDTSDYDCMKLNFNDKNNSYLIGISRSFTRKLHEWEKSRGIAPEASTSALLKAAKARHVTTTAPLTRTQSDGSVAASVTGSGRLRASSLSVNDVDGFVSDYERDHSPEATDVDGENTRGAVLVEVEAEEVCTAAPLLAVSPCHTPQKPIYTYGHAEARLLCETSSAITGTAVLQPNGAETRNTVSKPHTGARPKTTREQFKPSEKNPRRKLTRQTSIEEDAKFIKKAIKEVERGLNRCNENKNASDTSERMLSNLNQEIPSTSRDQKYFTRNDSVIEIFRSVEEEKRKETDKSNGKKKAKSRARLEREQSKPSESDSEPDVDTVTVEIPRRRKRPRRASEKPRTPPASLHSDSQEEVFVLKLKAPEPRDGSPEVIVKTTRKIFSPVVRSGESTPRAVIPVDVEDLSEVRRDQTRHESDTRKKSNTKQEAGQKQLHSKSSGDLQIDEDQRPRSRPPLPSSPSSQRKPQPKETSPSIRIMIQRYNKKINEEGNTSGPSSGASSPAWRSPISERRRPPDMPVGINIRNNPFLEREVQKSASACQLSRRDQNAGKIVEVTPEQNIERVLKSHSANALHPERSRLESPPPLLMSKIEDSQETIRYATASTDTIVPDQTKIQPNYQQQLHESLTQSLSILKQSSIISRPNISRLSSEYAELFVRSISTTSSVESETTKISDRAARLKAAREKFLASPVSIRREGTSSATDLRPGDRSSRISCESDVTENQSPSAHQEPLTIGRSASTGMVNVEKEAWQRVAEGSSRREPRARSRFSLARLAAKIRRKDDGAVSRLCRQSLLVQLRNKH